MAASHSMRFCSFKLLLSLAPSSAPALLLLLLCILCNPHHAMAVTDPCAVQAAQVQPVSIVVVLDKSDSMGTTGFMDEKTFARYLLEALMGTPNSDIR